MTVKTAPDAPATLSTGVVAEPAERRFWVWLNKRMPVEEFYRSQLTGLVARQTPVRFCDRIRVL